MKLPESSGALAQGAARSNEVRPGNDTTEIAWGTLAKAAAAFLGVSVAALNLIGHIAYSNWMDHWGLDAGIIPLDSNERLIHGYVAFTDRFVSLLNTWPGWFAAVFFITLGVYSSIVLTARAAAKRGRQRRVELAWVLESTPWWLRQILLGWGLSGGLVVWLYAMLISASLILVAAPAIGKSYSDAWARRMEARIQKGCQSVQGHSTCTEIVRDGQPIGAGLILASSTTHVAFYDQRAKRTRLVRLDGADLTGWTP